MTVYPLPSETFVADADADDAADGELETVDDGCTLATEAEVEAAEFDELSKDEIFTCDVEDTTTTVLVVIPVAVEIAVEVVERTVLFAETVETAREIEAAAVLMTAPPGASYSEAYVSYTYISM